MSNLEFKFGSENNPKGHAIIYFEEYDEIYAAYIMNFPISGDLSKYIPEMFKDQIPDEEMTKMISRKLEKLLEQLLKILPRKFERNIFLLLTLLI